MSDNLEQESQGQDDFMGHSRVQSQGPDRSIADQLPPGPCDPADTHVDRGGAKGVMSADDKAWEETMAKPANQSALARLAESLRSFAAGGVFGAPELMGTECDPAESKAAEDGPIDPEAKPAVYRAPTP